MKTAPVVIEIWKQLDGEIHHRDTLVMQVTLSILLFLSVFGALIQYFPELKFPMWAIGFLAIGAACVFMRRMRQAKIAYYDAMLEAQANFKDLPPELTAKLERVKKVRKPSLSYARRHGILLGFLVAFWIYLGLVEVIGLPLPWIVPIHPSNNFVIPLT
jgi:hypothetical protein